jgi:hypothetical protein
MRANPGVLSKQDVPSVLYRLFVGDGHKIPKRSLMVELEILDLYSNNRFSRLEDTD